MSKKKKRSPAAPRRGSALYDETIASLGNETDFKEFFDSLRWLLGHYGKAAAFDLLALWIDHFRKSAPGELRNFAGVVNSRQLFQVEDWEVRSLQTAAQHHKELSPDAADGNESFARALEYGERMGASMEAWFSHFQGAFAMVGASTEEVSLYLSGVADKHPELAHPEPLAQIVAVVHHAYLTWTSNPDNLYAFHFEPDATIKWEGKRATEAVIRSYQVREHKQ